MEGWLTVFDNGLEKGLWPARTGPQPDELLSSWLVRLAMAHGLKLHTFCSMAWPKKSIWNRDIDKSADGELIAVLSERTGCGRERVGATTLAAYEGWLYERHNPNGNTLWVMPVGVYHRTRRNFGLQFCPRCLGEDREPYYRRSWRLAFITFCEVHHSSLLDRCPKCGEPVNFHRDEMGRRDQAMARSLTRCHACKFDLRRSESGPITTQADERVFEFQKALAKVMQLGWVEIPPHGAIYSHLYFTVVHHLMRLCAMGEKSAVLREAVSLEVYEGTPAPRSPPTGRDVERMGVAARRRALDMARHLLDGWPHGFIRLCQKNKVWSSVLLRDLEPAPFWYWSVIHAHLYRISYVPSEQEILSAISHLNRKGVPLCKKSISRCLGTNNDVFRKRKFRAEVNCELPGSDKVTYSLSPPESSPGLSRIIPS